MLQNEVNKREHVFTSSKRKQVKTLTIVYTANARPELLLEQIGQRVCGLLSSVGSVPLALGIAKDQIPLRVRGVLEHIALLGLLALFDLADLVADADHGIDESVQLLLALTLSGLNHECVGHRPAHSGGVEAIVLETLGNIDSFDTGSLLEGTSIDDEFVSATALLVGVENGVVVLEAGKHVVGVEESHSSSLAETLVT